MHWSHASRPNAGQHPPLAPSSGNNSCFPGANHNPNATTAAAAMDSGGSHPVPGGVVQRSSSVQQPPHQALGMASGLPKVHTNNNNNASGIARVQSGVNTAPNSTGLQQAGGNNNLGQTNGPAPPPTASNTVPHNAIFKSSATIEREAPAIMGAMTVAAVRNHSNSVYLSGTRTNYTDVATAGFGANTNAPVAAGPTGSSDSNEEEINQLIRELECSIDSPHAPAVMRDTLEAIETRAVSNFDATFRDTIIEQRIRDILLELSRSPHEHCLLLAVQFIEGLLPIPYTRPQHKFTRLCRSLSSILQCGIEKPCMEAQRVYKQLLALDLQQPEPPLKTFVPKELKDSCEQALMQLHGRVQQFKPPYKAPYLAVMLIAAATVEVNPRYMSDNLRSQVIQLATLLAGSADQALRMAAFNCLCATFKNTSCMRHNEVVIENRRVCDESLRALNTSHHNETSIASTLMALRALLSNRGLQCIDKQVIPQLCILVTEQQRISKSPLVRSAVCDLVPIIAPFAISSAPRRAAYCAIIMEPVKNVRDERTKSKELNNVAAFIENVGYTVLDATNKTNLDSILHRYISRPETQEACWRIIAAICTFFARGKARHMPRTSSHNARSTTSRSGAAWHSSSDNIVGFSNVAPQPSAPSRTRHTPSGADSSANGRQPTASGPGDSPSPNAAQSPNAYNNETSLGGSPVAAHTGSPHLSFARAPRGSNSTVTASPATRGDGTNFSFSNLSNSELGGESELAGTHFLPNDRVPTGSSQSSPSGSPTAQTVAGSSNGTATNLENVVRRCIPFIVHAALSSNLVKYLTQVQEAVPAVVAEVQQALDHLVDATLKEMQSAPDVERSRTMGPDDAAFTLDSSGTNAPPVPSSSASQSARGDTTAVPGQGDRGALPGLENLSTLTSGMMSGGSGFSSSTPGGPYPPTAVGHTHSGSPNANAFSPTQTSPYVGPPATSDLTVALGAFSRRPVTSVQQLEEIKNVIVPFQRHEDPKVRMQSSETTISSLNEWINYAKEHKTSTYSTRVTEILESYVKNVLHEMDPACRLAEITLLANATNLRSFLSEQRILSALLSFLNGSAHVREKTVELLVAITQDPKPSTSVLAVQQSLYVTIESCVVVLEYTSEVRILLRSMADLQTFTRLCVRPLSNHLGRIFYAFRKKISNPENVPDVVLFSVLKTLETILIALLKEERTVLQYQDDVMELQPLVIEILKQTSSPALSHASINVLVNMNKMCPASANQSHKKQHDVIASLAHVYTSNTCTKEELSHILTLFGQLGAIDPTVQPHSESTKKRNEDPAIQDEADLELTYDYTVIVYRTLSRMLDVTLSEAVCSQALRTMLQFIRHTQDKKDLVGGVHAVRAVLQIAKRSTDSPALRIEALHVLTGITALRHERVARLVLPEIVVLLEQLWIPTDHALFRGVLELVGALKPGKLSGKEQSESWAWLYPRLVDVALQDHTETREFCLRVVEIFLNASYIPPHCIPIVFPMLIQFAQQADQLAEVRSQSLCAAVHIVCELKAVQYFPSLLHCIRTLTRHCDLNKDLGPRLSTPGVRESLKVLSALHPSGRPMIRQLRNHLINPDDRNAVVVSAYGNPNGYAAASISTVHPGGSQGGSAPLLGGSSGGNLLSSVTSPGGANVNAGASGTGGYGRGGPNNNGNGELSGDDEDAMGTAAVANAATSGQEISLFMKHIEWGMRIKESRLREWCAELQKCIILVSPHPAFRMMIDLFDKHEPLRRELFHPSFKSLYEVLSAEQIKKTNEVLTIVLNCNDSELSSKYLGLADYLDHNPPNIHPEVMEQLRAFDRADHRTVYASENEGFIRSTISVSSSDLGHLGTGAPSTTKETEPHNNKKLDPTTAATTEAPKNPSERGAAPNGTDSTADMHENSNAGAFTFESPAQSFSDNRTYAGAGGEKKTDGQGVAASSAATSELIPARDERKGSTAGRATGEENSDDSNFTSAFQSVCRSLGLHKTAHEATNELHKGSNETVKALETHIPTNPNILFSTENIVRAAERTRMYDKAFSYLENKLLIALSTYRYSKMPRDVIQKVVWPLAWLYSQREMQDSVVGLFHAIRYKGEHKDGFAFELLRWWGEAQRVYAQIVGNDVCGPMVTPTILEGYVRTLCFCGEWSKTLDVARQLCYKPNTMSPPSSTVAQCGATAAWLLHRWDDVTRLADCIPLTERNNAATRLFFLNGAHLRNAIAEGNQAAYDQLRQALTQSKLVVDESLRTLLPVSYSHAYENLTMLQLFTEMEETIDYCLCLSSKTRRQIVDRWNRRFFSLKPDSLHPSLRSIMLHSLVLNRAELSEMILHFCESMATDYPQLSQWAMDWLRKGVKFERDDCGGPGILPVASPTVPRTPRGLHNEESPNVVIGFVSHLWSQGHRLEAVTTMERFLDERGAELEVKDAKCYGYAQLRLGTWKQDLHSDSFWKKGYREEELGHFHKAIRAVSSSYEAWHSWGLMNYRVQQRDHKLTPEELRGFVEAAHQGFVAAISRCKNSSEALPGVMRLLQLWVIHNGVDMLKETVADSISRIPVDHWVQTIPQLIGHLSNSSHDVREVISMILRSLCEVHPQAVIFPLLVVLIPDDMDAFADSQTLRKRELVHSIIQHCPKRIYNEAETMAKLLVDVSAIPIEKIRENLSRVATAWNPNAEYEEDREEVHRRLQATLEAFQANRKHLLYTVGDIGQFVQMVIEDDHRGEREKAASIITQLVDEITKHVSEKLGKEPQKAMEPLLRIRNSVIAVFGEYDISSVNNCPTIASFSSKLDVIPSKKRPRRIQLNGSDGCLYTYCLKGNEDIRMDERVMQLFCMVNVLLSHTRTAASAYIHRFPVIPISSNVGLLGWVENANTINNTICNYRATISHVRAHQESNVLRSYVESFGQWDKLSIIQRTEVLDFVMSSENCGAVDVSRALWHRANTAEQWLDRRTAFTTSLATMSLVGYVLGLGDRHLGNILFSMSSGKIVHIDFGDSFDVGRLRHVLPETIPFRLTRMLTNAMEVFGVDGVFRASATRTQATLHKNRDSIMALLSAFVYDPIVQHKGKLKNMMEKSRSPQDVAERIRNKLRGMELAVRLEDLTIFNTTQDSCRRPDLLFMSKAFDDNAERVQGLGFTPDKQVNYLINEATRTDNYTTLYFGWGPLW